MATLTLKLSCHMRWWAKPLLYASVPYWWATGKDPAAFVAWFTSRALVIKAGR